MKMITKTFHKREDLTMTEIEALIEFRLLPGMVFDFDPFRCTVYGVLPRLTSLTPPALQQAWAVAEKITFSVTLPAKYWKKEIA